MSREAHCCTSNLNYSRHGGDDAQRVTDRHSSAPVHSRPAQTAAAGTAFRHGTVQPGTDTGAIGGRRASAGTGSPTARGPRRGPRGRAPTA